MELNSVLLITNISLYFSIREGVFFFFLYAYQNIQNSLKQKTCLHENISQIFHQNTYFSISEHSASLSLFLKKTILVADWGLTPSPVYGSARNFLTTSLTCRKYLCNECTIRTIQIFHNSGKEIRKNKTLIKCYRTSLLFITKDDLFCCF